MEYGNVGMKGKLNTGDGKGTRLRALDEQTLVPPDGYQTSHQYSNFPLFHNSISQRNLT
jgi:hypothetical protein